MRLDYAGNYKLRLDQLIGQPEIVISMHALKFSSSMTSNLDKSVRNNLSMH